MFVPGRLADRSFPAGCPRNVATRLLLVVATRVLVEYARRLEEQEPGSLAAEILMQTGQDCSGRDLLGQIASLIETVGVMGAADIIIPRSRR